MHRRPLPMSELAERPLREPVKDTAKPHLSHYEKSICDVKSTSHTSSISS